MPHACSRSFVHHVHVHVHMPKPHFPHAQASPQSVLPLLPYAVPVMEERIRFKEQSSKVMLITGGRGVGGMPRHT